MKFSVLVFILGLVLLLALSSATEMEENARACGSFMWKCSERLPCCQEYVCSPQWKWCQNP
uniref:U1-theraphotoxin-Agm3a n=1 Tax=Acanthoscurria gomesiana TaxID=115339 RepID=VSTX1_ACAGO|nr:RecName: Full=U1-theraphotoxin-Agm3a; Short=U1-TRTX-Agm3a; Flags: Precursor [Acanthoscurria gomesiana]